MRGTLGGDDGAARRLPLPNHATLGPQDHTVYRLGRRTKRLGIRPDHPTDDRLSDFALSCGRGIEHGEVEQGVGVALNRYP